MSVDVLLLRKYVEWVEEQETLTEGREWLQDEWISEGNAWLELYGIESYAGVDFCDTAYCLAGKVAVDAGWKPTRNGGTEYSVRVVKGGLNRPVREVACELLGIEDENPLATALFRDSNTAADIRRVAEDIAGERL